jgi:DNA replication protein DnaC
MRNIRKRVIDPNEDPARWRSLMANANLPDRYWNAREELVQAPEARAWLTKCLAEALFLANGSGFYIFGQLNAGKSSVAALYVMEALRRAERALWLPVREVPAVRFRETPAHVELAAKLDAADLVVLDDLGSEGFRTTGAAGAALEAAARIIYDRRRSLVITSNIAWPQFEATYCAAGAFASVVKRMVFPLELRGAFPEEPGALAKVK